METNPIQHLRLLPNLQLREFEGNPAAPDPTVPVRILRQVLLVIVGAEVLSGTEITELSVRGQATGRLSVDVTVESPVDRHGFQSLEDPNYCCSLHLRLLTFPEVLGPMLELRIRALACGRAKLRYQEAGGIGEIDSLQRKIRRCAGCENPCLR
jgi:hypothetical protein